MTYTGKSRITVARDLLTAADTTNDVWLRDEHGEDNLVLTAVRTGDTVTVTVDECAWPAPQRTRQIVLGLGDRISTRVY